jgi:hypothetical protein
MGIACSENSHLKSVSVEAGYVLEDVTHINDYIPDLPVSLSLSLSLSEFFILWICLGLIWFYQVTVVVWISVV